jgi:hypothetical protein
MSLILTIALAFSLAAMAPLSAAWTGSALELPFRARMEPVIEDGEIEGRRVRVARFTTPLQADELARVVRREWRGAEGADLVETRLPGWRVLSSWSAEGFRTLQFRPGRSGGSEGVLSVWPAGGADGVSGAGGSGTGGSGTGGLGAGAGFGSAGTALPGPELLPEGSAVLRRFSAVDAGRRGQTLVAVAEGSPSWLADAIGQRLAARGYAPDPVLHSAGARGEARRFRRADAEVVFTVSPAGPGRSGVVLHASGAAP